MITELLKKIERHQVKVAIVGLGYVGIPLALGLAGKGISVVGVDLDPERVDTLNRGVSPFPDLPSEELVRAVGSGFFRATCNHGVLGGVDVIIIDVPTPLSRTREPDVSMVHGAVSQVSEFLRPGQLVVIESTTYPGFTREVACPMLEASGLRTGKDYFLAFSPERIDPANESFGVDNTPKIVGGMTRGCTKVASAFYQLVARFVHTVSSTDAAEMVKLHENTFRAVNIGLANEVALMSRKLGIDPWEVIDAASTKPFGFMPFYPGPGLGGHCIPVDPIYLSWKMRTLNYTVRFIELAEAINSTMPDYVISRLQDILNQHHQCLSGCRILLMGMAYKPEVGDMRESPALAVAQGLVDKGAEVSFHDPFVSQVSLLGLNLVSVDWKAACEDSDCVLILTHHRNIDYSDLVERSRLVFDTRGITRNLPENPKVFRL